MHEKKINLDFIQSLTNKSFSILQVAKMFGQPIKLIPLRKGERFVSALTNMHLNKKFIKCLVN